MPKFLKPKKSNLKFYGFNIKLQTNNTKNDDTYFNLIRKIYQKDIAPNIGGEKAMLFKTQFVEQYLFKGKRHKVLHGNLVRYTILERDHWFNTKNKEIEKFDPPENLHPNGFETSYLFIPAAHRLYAVVNTKVSHTSILNFLTKALKEVISPKDEIIVNLIQSHNTFQQILEAKTIKSLKINVSYTNDDASDAAKKAMDKLLKEANVGETDINLKPDATGSLDSDSEMVVGLLELAQENGNAVASIINQNNKSQTIITNEYPAKREVVLKENDDVNNVLFNDIMNEYRNNEEGSN